MLQMLQAGFQELRSLRLPGVGLGKVMLQHLQQVAFARSCMGVVAALDVANVAYVRVTTEITLLTLLSLFYPLILYAPRAQATSATSAFLGFAGR